MTADSVQITSRLFDTQVPLLICKTGRYPNHHGGLFLARSVGRMGVPVAAMVESRFTPLAVSRYVTQRYPALQVQPTADEFVARIASIARDLRVRPVLAATDDEAAVLIDENADDLAPYARVPRQVPGMSRRVATKSDLSALCTQLGVGTPRTMAPASVGEFVSFAEECRYPLVVKNEQPFSRRTRPGVDSTLVLNDADQAHDFAKLFDPQAPVIVQEYIPREHQMNLIYQGYRSSGSEQIVSFTGVKWRDWPVGSGETTLCQGVVDVPLRALGERLLDGLDYRGVCDLDVVVDRRDASLNLVDFNPRFGANAAAFVARNGLDLVRAYHLDLTGQPLPASEQVDGVFFQVEHSDRLALRGGHPDRRVAVDAVSAFTSPDDPRPGVASGVRRGLGAVRRWGRSG